MAESLKQLRQRVDYAMARVENLVDEGMEALGHLSETRSGLTYLIDDEAEPSPEPEPEPEPQPADPSVQVIDWASYRSMDDLLDDARIEPVVWAGNKRLSGAQAAQLRYLRLASDPDPVMGGVVLRTVWPGVYGANSDDQLAVEVRLEKQSRRVALESPIRFTDWALPGPQMRDDKGIWMLTRGGHSIQTKLGAYSNRIQIKVDNNKVPTPDDPAGVAHHPGGGQADVGDILWTGEPFVLHIAADLDALEYSLDIDFLDGRGKIEYIPPTKLPGSLRGDVIERISLGRNAGPPAGAIRDFGRTTITSL